MKKKSQKSPQKRNNSLIFFIVPYILLIVLVVVLIFSNKIQKEVDEIQLRESKSYDVATYPSFGYVYDPYLSAQAALILDDESKRILYSKNPTLRFSTASTAKIMTAFVALQHFEANDIFTVFDDDVEGTVVGFPVGETVYFDDLLYSMMLASGNDAAYTIAENFPGGVDAFVQEMNRLAQKHHLSDTHFADPAGLNDDENYTTVVDLARLCSIALQNKTLERIVSTKQRVFSNVAGTATYEVFNINKLLGSYGIVGIKTGQTIGAGGVLTTAKMENGRKLIIVVMHSTDRFGDTLSLVNLVNNNLSYFTPVSQQGK